MSVIQIIVHPQVVSAALVYAVLAVIGIALFDRVHAALDHSALLWKWEHIGMPLLRAALMLCFILLAYPALFGVDDAPPLSGLLAREELRLASLFNLIFIITLLLPLLPVLGEREELVLPLQGLAASLLLFSWLARARGVTPVSYWPGWDNLALMLALALLTHWLAVSVSAGLGEWLDKKLDVIHTGELVSHALILFLQYPVIIVFCQGLGEQLG